MKDIPVALQVYTVRDELAKDYGKTLENVRGIGYENIEIGGFGAFNTNEWNKIVRRLEFGEIVSTGFEIDMYEQSLNPIMEFCLGAGIKRLVVPYLREERRSSEEGYKRVADTLNQIGLKCSEKGISLHYHNHSFEFQKYGDMTGHEILLENTDPRYVWFEFDTYWLQHGGQNPADYIRKYANRLEILHLKDMLNDENKSYAEIGEGIIDFKEVFKAASDANIKWLIVEQDICSRPSIECAKLSLENIKKLKAEIGMKI
jgi:sugar phosphate isomerase/epimerase